LLMATFRAALRSEVRRRQPIPDVIEDVHRTLAESMDTSRFVTAVYGILDPEPGTFTYANCGHNPPLLMRYSGAQEFLQTGRRAVGMLDSQPTPTSMVTLAPGDMLVLYTDGVIEVSDPRDAEFGTTGLTRVLAASANQPADHIIHAVVDATRAHARTDHFTDDFTLMVVKRAR